MRVLFVSLFIVIADQVSKLFVKGFSIPFLNLNVTGMDYGQSINVIGDFFRITFVENPGMAFGIDLGNSTKLFLSLFSLFASVGIFYYLFTLRNNKLIIKIALALILGGAIGNLIDRTFYGVAFGYAPLFYGKVVDFFHVEFFDFSLFGKTYQSWPIFNVADSAVTVGVILLILFHKNTKSVQVPEALDEDPLKEQVDLVAENEDVVKETNNLNITSDNGEDNKRKEI